MNSWIIHPLVLTGLEIQLLPLQKEHIAELVAVAHEKAIWEFYAIDGSNKETILKSLESAATHQNDNEYPFTIYHRGQQKIIGSTRYLDIKQENRKLEIGWTWLHPQFWASTVNLECKLLLLTHCFETLKAVRVTLKTDERNIRSRKAIEKIGGKLEGIFRNDMIRENNTKRNSAYFSIIEEDWPEVQKNLTALLLAKREKMDAREISN